MKQIHGFLEKFLKLTPPNDAIRVAVAHAASNVLGVPIGKERVQVKNGTAFIDISSVAKNKLRIERGSFFQVLYERMPKARELVRDLR
jgi:hypothetical protein